MCPSVSAALTTTGRRANNEDAFLVEPGLGLFAVADGMGGYEGGEIASRLALGEVRSFMQAMRDDPEHTWPFSPAPELSPDERVVDQAIRVAHRSVMEARTPVTKRMGTTIATLVQPRPGARWLIAHVGDSRVYRLRKGKVELLTRDHSFVEELRAIGALGAHEDVPEHLRSRLTRALGVTGWTHPTLTRVDVKAGDRFLLCTDGLSGVLDATALAAHMAARSPQEAASRLVDAALARGSMDNITAVLIDMDHDA